MSRSSTERVSKVPGPGVRAWLRPLKASLRRDRLRVSDADALRLAALLSLVGEPGTPEGTDAWWAFQTLFLRRRSATDRRHNQVGRLSAALDHVPPTREGVRRVVESVRAFRDVAGGDPTRDFPLDRVVRVMAEVPDPRAYVEHLHRRGMSNLPGMFHPNTLERARKELRGVFGRFEGENEYWEEVRGGVRTVE